ncbi:MAG: cyclic pyranopterin monophosphate synthase MoaC, partial [Cytophagales bacterium]|nr:cyclic pyranopterin monophosphate synthase MoaC [Cytophagales bacterium]
MKIQMADHFSHLNKTGDPTMVDIAGKSVTERVAVAQSVVVLDPAIISRFEQDEIHTKKGPVFQTAIIAGVMAAKK